MTQGTLLGKQDERQVLGGGWKWRGHSQEQVEGAECSVEAWRYLVKDQTDKSSIL